LKGSAVQVDLGPLEREDLAFTHPGVERDGVQRGEAVALRAFEERVGLLFGQRGHLAALDARRTRERRGVALDVPALLGLTQRPAEHGAKLSHGRRSRTSLQARFQKVLDVLRSQLLERDPADMLRRVARELGVAPPRCWPDLALLSFEPFRQERAECLSVAAER
jgi:hypothetical protein